MGICFDGEELTQDVKLKEYNTNSYYINTNEIPGELLRENMISSHVKITCFFSDVKRSPLLWLHKNPLLMQPKTVQKSNS